MTYKHSLAIKHMPKFIAGVFLTVVCSMAVIGGIYVISIGAREEGTVILTALNCVGLIVGTMIFLPESLQYTATEIPDKELTPAEQLKK